YCVRSSLTSFPTRRSSDLGGGGRRAAGAAGDPQGGGSRQRAAAGGPRMVRAGGVPVDPEGVDGPAAHDARRSRYGRGGALAPAGDRKSTRLNSSHVKISYA